jgi:hypothetical protein
MMWFSAATLVVAIAGVTGCGSPSASSPGTNSTITKKTVTPVSKPKPAMNAKQIVDALKEAGMSVGKEQVYTASNDPNKLLGRPGEYTSKVNFVDTRVKESVSSSIDVTNGGSVEVFSNAKDAKTRYAYVSNIAKSSPMFSEYDYLDKNVVLRVSTDFTPTQAKAYDSALKKVLG